jgi:ParB family chromosome partitioning protein
MSKRLGKGIEALISSYNTEENDRYIDGAIPLKNIVPNKNQPRKSFDNDAMEELKNSIAENGVIQPITVRQIGDEKYEIISGERRYRSALALNLESIPAYILSVDTDAEMMEFAIIENVQRENLNPMEEAEGYAILNDKYGLSQDEIAQKVGKSRPEIANTLRLIKLPPNIRNSLKLSREEGGISKGHARALLTLKDGQKIQRMFQRIVNEGLSVRQTESLVKSVSSNKPTMAKKIKPQKTDSNLSKIESDLMSALGTKVIIQKSAKGKGKISIEYYSDDELERLIELLS